MSTRVAVVVSLVLTAAAGAYFGWVYAALPAQMPSHWNVHGEVDGWTSKSSMAWAMPLLMLGLTGFMAAAQWLSPRGWDVAPFRPTFNTIVVIIVAMVAYIWVVSAVVAMRPDAEGSRLILGGLLVFIAAMANFLGKVRRNFWMGIRLPWTLASDRVWVATHRLAARLITAAAAIGAVAVLAGAPMALVFGGLLAAVVIPCVYSLVLYKRQEPPAATAVAVMIASFALAVGGPAASVEAQGAAGGAESAGAEAAVEAAAEGDEARATETEVTFEGAGGLALKGTLRMPAVREGAEAQRFPAAVLLPGSGPPDRDGNVKPVLVTDILKQIAERLAEEGIATLRFDKRSVAASYAWAWPKDLEAVNEFFSWENFVGDAKAAAGFLREQEGVDGARVAMVGHSEGGLITLQAAHDWAGMEEAPAAIVLLGTAGRRLDHVVRNQVADGLKRQGVSEEIAKEYNEASDRAIEQIKRDGTVPEGLQPGLRPLFNPTATRLLRAYFTVEPAELAAAYAGPVLIVQGERDIQVLAEVDAPALERAFAEREGGKVELMVVEGASHNFKLLKSEQDPGFAGPVAPEALEKIAAWLKRELGG